MREKEIKERWVGGGRGGNVATSDTASLRVHCNCAYSHATLRIQGIKMNCR